MRIYNWQTIEVTETEMELLVLAMREINKKQLPDVKRHKAGEMLKMMEKNTSPYTTVEVDPDGLEKIMNKMEKGESL